MVVNGLLTSEEVRIPAQVPRILKEYTKAALRTQPRDLLTWSRAYFKALAEGTVPPVKDRLEYPLPESDTGITPGILRVLHRQLKDEDLVTWNSLQEACEALGVDKETTRKVWNSAKASNDNAAEGLPWDNILVHAAYSYGDSISEALQLVMKTSAEDPASRGVTASEVLGPYHYIFSCIYGNPNDSSVWTSANAYLEEVAEYQDGFLAPSDLTRPSCPVLE
ncbi:ropporin-1-like protein [Oratosquilla oratoria]|uniref:ropporin-1-like protein n=1 Tax=Oratosquilla oratoria TaxID=337810 RepID=UPI003F757EFC